MAQSLAQMLGYEPEDEAPQPQMQPVGISTGGTLENDLAGLRQQQEASLKQHTAFAQGLQSQQDQVNQRAQDLDISERLMVVLDTSLPKFARGHLFRELSNRLGIDPRGETSKELARTLVNLDPDSAQGIKSMFVGQLSSAAPGSVSQFATSILRGEVGLHEVVKLIGSARAQSSAAPQGRAAFEAQFGAPMRAGIGDVAPTQEQPTSTQEYAVPKATTQPGEMIPEMAERLGYGNAPITNREAMEKKGYTGPTNPNQQNKTLQERNIAEGDRYRLLDRFIGIAGTERGDPAVSPNPEILFVGRIPTFAQYMRWYYNNVSQVVKEGLYSLNCPDFLGGCFV